MPMIIPTIVLQFEKGVIEDMDNGGIELRVAPVPCYPAMMWDRPDVDPKKPAPHHEMFKRYFIDGVTDILYGTFGYAGIASDRVQAKVKTKEFRLRVFAETMHSCAMDAEGPLFKDIIKKGLSQIT